MLKLFGRFKRALTTSNKDSSIVACDDVILCEKNLTLSVKIKTRHFTMVIDNICYVSELYDRIDILTKVNVRSTLTMSCEDIITRGKYYLVFKGKPLPRNNLSLVDYNIHNMDTIEYVPSCLMGGCDKVDLPAIKFGESYNVTLELFMLQNKDFFEFVLQSEETFDVVEFQNLAKKHFSHIISREYDWIWEGLHNMSMIVHWYKKCTSFYDFVQLTSLAFKLFTNTSCVTALTHRLEFLFKSQVQADQFGDILNILRKGLTGVQNVSDIALCKKVVSLYSYLLVHGYLAKFGIKISDEDYTRLEQKALYVGYSSKKEMWLCILDTVLFMCERAYDFSKTGEISVFLHNSSEYTKWLKEADRILSLSAFTSNLEAHNTTYFTYIADLDDTIERGEAYAKYTLASSGVDCALLKKKLYALQILKNTEVTKRSSQRERQAPYGVLVYGTSSVAKSTFTKMLFYYYGKLHGLGVEDHFRYVRNPADEYWTNFNSSKWFIHLDDIAFLLPRKTTEVDPTLKEMLNVVNNVPYVPPQAALEDKGKTPVMAKLVVATSNSSDLNANDYFWCPLAIRRRLPFVIKVEPKPEYIHMNKRFIDPEKLSFEDGEFPNYWIITVQKIKPYFDGQRDMGQLEDVQVFEDVNEFLRFFGESTLAHQNVQDKSDTCDSGMRDIVVCTACLYSTKHCKCIIQANAKETFMYYVGRGVDQVFRKTCDAVVSMQMYTYLHIRMARFRMYRYIYTQYLSSYVSRPLVVMQRLGEMNQNVIAKPKNLIRFTGVLLAISGCVGIYCYMKNKKKDEKKIAKQFDSQGNMYGTVAAQLLKEEKQNVWYNSKVELTTFDVPTPSRSLTTMDTSDVREKFGRNCVRLMVQGVGENAYTLNLCGVFIKSHICMTNNHAFREGCDSYKVTIIQSYTAQGINSNITINIQPEDVQRMVNKDICVFEVKSVPPFKDIHKYWNEKVNTFSKVIGVRRTKQGNLEAYEVYKAHLIPKFPVEALHMETDVIMGDTTDETKVGDCGAICVNMTPLGPVISGLHMIGYKNKCGFTSVYKRDIDILVSKLTSCKMLVQGGGKPLLDLTDKVNIVSEPHHRSLFRYLPEGTLNIYGSFTGFRARPKSKVCETPLNTIMKEHFGIETKHGPPCMDGWEPWKLNIQEMVKPHVDYDRRILKECVSSFTDDIITALPNEWERELVFLERRASVNGLPGVIFIDGINRNSSMGFPWCSSKKNYLINAIDEVYPDGVDFPQEVWERVDHIEQCYREGKRAFPVFTGHLKDEPTAFAKIEKKKTRVFTGAPIDWSLVVRSRLLSFIRLLQKNKFVFEAGPGTVCQSSEWGDIYRYLTRHGVDQMVAGDYGKFDKRMIADFILAAFEIICNIYQKAGFDDTEVREIMCIGEDTAFPVVNMNGDLVEFFGTNPSGHPLTVVINSLVNSLYMRYVYLHENPDKEVKSFKKNVCLFTYGDDNIMGISKEIPWFNHTVMQRVLAQIGVEYTMADKESESVPYIHIDDCSFLKRKWVFNEEVNDYLCPLDVESIHKSLTVWLPSKTVCPEEQMVSVISSANSEFFFYGRKIFEKHHKFFRSILDQEPYKFYESEGTLPSWAQLKQRFEAASK